jgi:hypothetical protein
MSLRQKRFAAPTIGRLKKVIDQESRPGLFAFRYAVKQTADLPGGVFNFLAAFFHSGIVGFGSQERRSPDNDGELIINRMQNLLRKSHTNLLPRELIYARCFLNAGRFCNGTA